MSRECDSRDLAEIERSAGEARATRIEEVDVRRYLNPGPNTPYPLEYAFHLLGNVVGKTVLDLGCGSGECIPALAARGANVVGVDLSPELIALAQERLRSQEVDTASLRVGSAYDTGLSAASVDVAFCMSLLHHLEIPRAMAEIQRVLRPDGYAIVKEPIRLSRVYNRVRSFFPEHDDISEYEHPLTRDELSMVTRNFAPSDVRFFRLPFVPLVKRRPAWRASALLLRKVPALNPLATVIVMKLGTKIHLDTDAESREVAEHHHRIPAKSGKGEISFSRSSYDRIY